MSAVITDGFKFGAKYLITDGFAISKGSLPPSYATKTTGTLLTEIMVQMETESHDSFWETGFWIPGFWDECKLLNSVIEAIKNS